MSSVSHRRTQFDLGALARAEQISSSNGHKSQIPKIPTRDVLNPATKRKAAHPPLQESSNSRPVTSKTDLKTDEPPVVAPLRLRRSWESSWKQYQKIYDLELAGSVEVAVRKSAPIELVHIRKFSNRNAEEVLHRFRSFQHQNIVTAREAFATDSLLYIVLEPMSISLDRIVKSPAYPDAQQLAAILGQILNGLSYLAENGLEHGSLCCSMTLLNSDGSLKIASQNCRQQVGKADLPNRDLRALSSITVELMQKYVKDDGTVGIDNLDRWHAQSDAVQFLSATESATSAAELLKQPLFARPWQQESLVGLISLVQVCLRGRYKYTPQV